MASLKEIKNHIVSVKSTLKITSAMKMVASAKLRKSQQAIENMRPYEALLSRVLAGVGSVSLKREESEDEPGRDRVALVVIASNSSLCGGFNSNVIREARERIDSYVSEGREVEVFSIGRKVAEAMRKSLYPSRQDWSSLVAKPDYDAVSSFAQSLVDEYLGGVFSKVEVIYNHFVNNAVQKVRVEQYLPFDAGTGSQVDDKDEYILEPDREELLKVLVPKVVRLKLYTIVLDSLAAEHAARTIAMQTATDNGEEILRQLTLEYNKSRQQKITAEILDIVGGMSN